MTGGDETVEIIELWWLFSGFVHQRGGTFLPFGADGNVRRAAAGQQTRFFDLQLFVWDVTSQVFSLCLSASFSPFVY